MKVKDLILELQKQDPESQVTFEDSARNSVYVKKLYIRQVFVTEDSLHPAYTHAEIRPNLTKIFNTKVVKISKWSRESEDERQKFIHKNKGYILTWDFQ